MRPPHVVLWTFSDEQSIHLDMFAASCVLFHKERGVRYNSLNPTSGFLHKPASVDNSHFNRCSGQTVKSSYSKHLHT